MLGSHAGVTCWGHTMRSHVEVTDQCRMLGSHAGVTGQCHVWVMTMAMETYLLFHLVFLVSEYLRGAGQIVGVDVQTAVLEQLRVFHTQ